MFPHPETVSTVREMDRRRLLDQITKERAAWLAAAEATSHTDRIGPRRLLPVLRLAPRRLGRLPLICFFRRSGGQEFAR